MSHIPTEPLSGTPLGVFRPEHPIPGQPQACLPAFLEEGRQGVCRGQEPTADGGQEGTLRSQRCTDGTGVVSPGLLSWA